MKKELTLPDRRTFVLRVARDVLARLNTTCFGSLGGQPFAGKFARWPNIDAMFKDSLFVDPFLARAQQDLEKVTSGGDFRTRFTLDLGEAIGWDTTAPREGIGDDELGEHNLNMMVSALIVKADSPRKAPLTSLVTLSCCVSNDGDVSSIEIYSINPGFDIGWVSASNGEGGNITKKHGRVFFDFIHPGEELAAA